MYLNYWTLKPLIGIWESIQLHPHPRGKCIPLYTPEHIIKGGFEKITMCVMITLIKAI